MVLNSFTTVADASPPSQGAWIEILKSFVITQKGGGRPLHRGRGLKFDDPQSVGVLHRRPLHRGRGLKYDIIIPRFKGKLSPPSQGAWIEIAGDNSGCSEYSAVAPFTGGVD